MESTGQRNRIHLSQETANLLQTSGKGHWIAQREDRVFAKGKGELVTYWLQMKGECGESLTSTSDGSVTNARPIDEHSSTEDQTSGSLVLDDGKQALVEKYSRLVEWNTDLLSLQLRAIIAERQATESAREASSKIRELEQETMGNAKRPLDEVEDIITLPHYVERKKEVKPQHVKISDDVREQLRHYVQSLSSMYRDNAFHSFEVRVTCFCVKHLVSLFSTFCFPTACFTRHHVSPQVVYANSCSRH